MEMEGERLNSVNYHNGDGFYFRKIREKVTVEGRIVYVRCVVDGCKGSGKVNKDIAPEMRVVQVLTEHNGHEADVMRGKKLELLAIMKRKRVLEDTKSRALFDRECASHEAGDHVSFNRVESTLYKRKRKVVPNIPGSLQEFATLLENQNVFETFGHVHTLQPELFYQGLLVGEESSTAVFALPSMLAELSKAKELHIDGTFKVVPKIGELRQLVSIHIAVGTHTFPAVCALMTRKTTAAYELLFNFVDTVLAPGLSPRRTMSDFEASLMAAIRNVYPQAQQSGCWFHFAKAIWTKCQLLGLVPLVTTNSDAAQFVRMSMVLPLLPSHQIIEGYHCLELFLTENNLQNEFRAFMVYLKRQWLDGVGVHVLSVYRERRRTNNNVESFHRTLLERIGQANPSFWTFITNLGKTAAFESQQLRRHRNHIVLKRAAKKKYLANSRRIRDATDSLDANPGPDAVMAFLESAQHAVGGTYGFFRDVGLRANPEDDDVNVIHAAIQPPANPQPRQAQPATDMSCVVCKIEMRTHAARPCKHFIVCQRCADVLSATPPVRRTCPICRQQVRRYEKMFLN